VNHVLAGDYNGSLLEPVASGAPPASPAGAPIVGDAALLLRDFLAQLSGRRSESIDVDTDLIESGIVDSIGMLELFAFLESLTGGPIDDYRISLDGLRSVRRILEGVVADVAVKRVSGPAQRGMAAASA
jgi:2-isopropylmalate synthase